MTEYHGKDFTLTVGGTTIDTMLDNVSISMDRDTAEVTAAADSAKEFVGGDYTCTWSIGGAANFTDTTGSDEVMFGNFDAGADSWVFKPDDAAVGATNPTYTQNVIITNYTLTASIGDAVRASWSGQGTGAITRAEA